MTKKIAIIALNIFFGCYLHSISVSDAAPSFANPDLENRFVLAKDVFGKEWVLLDFFATWCEPCKKELPEIEKLLLLKRALPLKLVIIAIDETGEKAVRPYFEKNKTRGMLLLDKFKVTAERYGVTEIPKLFLISPERKIVKIFSGYTKDTAEEIKRVLEAAIK